MTGVGAPRPLPPLVHEAYTTNRSMFWIPATQSTPQAPAASVLPGKCRILGLTPNLLDQNCIGTSSPRESFAQ